MCCIYSEIKKLARKGEWHLDGEIKVKINEEEKLKRQREGTSVIDGKIDIRLFNENPGVVIIFEFKFNGSGKFGLDLIIKRRYIDALQTHQIFKNESTKHYVLIGLSLTSTGTLNMSYQIDSLNVTDSTFYKKRN